MPESGEQQGSALAKPVTFNVADMTCGHCAGTVRRAIDQALPTARVEIDLTTRRVTVAGDPAIATAAIEGAGYTPELLPDEPDAIAR